MLNLARLMARPREYEVRRAAAVRAFTPQKFRQEWELFWELVDPVLDGLEKATAVRDATLWSCALFLPLKVLVWNRSASKTTMNMRGSPATRKGNIRNMKQVLGAGFHEAYML